MSSIGSLLNALDERTVAQLIAITHDETRMRYALTSNTVRDFNEFKDIITDYCGYHCTSCVLGGGRLPLSEAYGRAKELLEKEYRRHGGDFVTAYNDAQDGTNGGLRVVLDTIADGLKAEAVQRYTADVFDRYVAPNSWEQKVDMIRQFIGYCGEMLSNSVVASQPERYAQNYNELINSYVEGLRRTSTMFRRL